MTVRTPVGVLFALAALSAAQFVPIYEQQLSNFISNTGLSLQNQGQFTAGVPNATVVFSCADGEVYALAVAGPASASAPTVTPVWKVDVPSAGAGASVHTARHIEALDPGHVTPTVPGAVDTVWLPAAPSVPFQHGRDFGFL